MAQTENRLGQAERELCGQAAANTLLPIRRFLEGDMKTIQKERKVLNSKRLDLDACKSRLKKAKTVDATTVVSSDFTCQTEVVAPYLKTSKNSYRQIVKPQEGSLLNRFVRCCDEVICCIVKVKPSFLLSSVKNFPSCSCWVCVSKFTLLRPKRTCVLPKQSLTSNQRLQNCCWRVSKRLT